MRLDVWTAIVAAHAQVRDLLDLALAGTGGTLDAARAGRLHSDLNTVLTELNRRLGPLLPERAVSDALMPLVIHVDEMVTTRLAQDDAASWPLLQQQNFGVDAGGDFFYRLADRRLAAPAAAPLTVEVLLFCLQSGFLGRASEDPDLVAGYRRRLSEALAETELPATAPPPVLRSPARASSGAGYYVATIVLIVVLPFLALVASRP